ncbi:MAG: hypothetical protein HRT74_11465 [Flavobacteriales bacterium]|nr:hypothetical protein [Flavobacteriales bacterium]
MIKYLRNNAVQNAEFGFLPDGLGNDGTNRPAQVPYDIAIAKKLLAEAGYTGGKGLPEIELSTTADYVDHCEFLLEPLTERKCQSHKRRCLGSRGWLTIPMRRIF